MNLEQKTAGAIETLQQTTRGGGCGMVGVGCGVIAALCLMMCVGSYFLAMHSSIPLSMIESALESEGNVQVEGLKGSISSGFEIESLKFESDECDEWNELRKIRFSYNGFFNVMRTKRLIISEASIGEATIYAKIDGDGEIDVASDIDGEEVAKEFSDEWQEMQDEFKNNNTNDLKELRIDMIRARNVALVDPNTGTRLEFAKVEFKDYQMLDGQLKRLGDLEVVSDQLDLHTEKSTRYADEPVAWNLKGSVKPIVHKTVIDDISFDIDFAIVGSDKFRLHVNLFEGQVEIDEPYGKRREIHLKNFSHADFFDTRSQLVPSDWNVDLTIDQSTIEVERPARPASGGDSGSTEPESKKPGTVNEKVHTLQIQPGSSFMLGKTRFEIETEKVVFGPDEQMEPAAITAIGNLDGNSIVASTTLRGEAPWFAVELSSDEQEPDDVWAGLFFEKPYVALNSEQQAQVDKARRTTDPLRALDEIEAVDF